MVSASWVLVVLTLAGGISTTQGSLRSCEAALRRVYVSAIREAYCVNRNDDRIYYIKGGKLLVLQ